MLTCTKKYINFPFAHRQPNHEGHCKSIHGHNWAFEFVFACHKLDSNGFVIDFGSLGWLKDFLNEMFDHTLVLNQDDPRLEYIRVHLGFPMIDLRIVPNCGAEGLAAWLMEEVNSQLAARIQEGRVFLKSVTVFEDDKNSATAHHAALGGCACA